MSMSSLKCNKLSINQKMSLKNPFVLISELERKIAEDVLQNQNKKIFKRNKDGFRVVSSTFKSVLSKSSSIEESVALEQSDNNYHHDDNQVMDKKKKRPRKKRRLPSHQKQKRCLICRAEYDPPEIETSSSTTIMDKNIGHRFSLYRKLVQILDSNNRFIILDHRLPDVDFVDEEFQYFCEVCFKAVRLLWEVVQQLENTREKMNDIVKKIKNAIQLKRPVTFSKDEADYSMNNNKRKRLVSKKMYEWIIEEKQSDVPQEEDVHFFPNPIKPIEIKETISIADDEENNNNADFFEFTFPASDQESEDKDPEYCPKKDSTAEESKGQLNDETVKPASYHDKKKKNNSPSTIQKRARGRPRILASMKPEMFTCEHCGLSFRVYKYMRDHQKRMHEDNKPHSCKHCNKRYFKKADLVRHLRTHTGEKPEPLWKCDQCEMTLRTKWILNHHKKRVHEGIKRFQCEQCNLEFYRNVELKRHLQVHTGVKPHQCITCGKRFSDLSYLNQHRILVCGEMGEESKNMLKAKINKKIANLRAKGHKCLKCCKYFLTESSLEWHVKSRHTNNNNNDEETLCICELCGMTLKSAQRIRYHKRRVHEKTHHQCDQCSYQCYKKVEMRKHLKTHNNNNNKESLVDIPTVQQMWECEICKIFFKLKEYLTQHTQRIHEGRKRHKCQFCTKSFFAKCDFIKHTRRVHEQLKNHKCDKCDKTFFRGKDLIVHKIKKHTRGKYDCKRCRKKFRTQYNKMQHYKLKLCSTRKKNVRTKIHLYTCLECGKSYKYKGSFNLHISKHKDDDLNYEDAIQEELSTIVDSVDVSDFVGNSLPVVESEIEINNTC